MENFQFNLLTYRPEAQSFLREVSPDVLTNVHWCGSLRNMIVSHTVPRHTYGTSRKLFCHTPGLTPQLRLRPGRPMFAPADFEHRGV
jgi:hypothetical protein